jgi:predicted acetyltransferase
MESEALAYRSEFRAAGEPMIYGGAGLDRLDSYGDWLAKVHSDLTRDGGGFVPATTYFAVFESRIVGTISIRHKLNDKLLNYGGHIGYAVRPSDRRKGYATKMLALALVKCRELGIGRVLVTCDKQNVGSARTIIKNGGVLEDERSREDGGITQRYWITIV